MPKGGICGRPSYDEFLEKLTNDEEKFKEIVLQHFTGDEILELYEKKTKKSVINKRVEVAPCDLPLEESYLIDNTKDLAQRFIASITDGKGDRHKEVERVAKVAAKAINADSFSVYVPIQNETEIALYNDGNLNIVGAVGLGRTVSAHCVHTKTTLLVENLKQDAR